jgi:hypothetical protein
MPVFVGWASAHQSSVTRHGRNMNEAVPASKRWAEAERHPAHPTGLHSPRGAPPTQAGAVRRPLSWEARPGARLLEGGGPDIHRRAMLTKAGQAFGLHSPRGAPPTQAGAVRSPFSWEARPGAKLLEGGGPDIHRRGDAFRWRRALAYCGLPDPSSSRRCCRNRRSGSSCANCNASR